MYSKFIISAFITALSLLTAVAQTPDSKMERDAPLNRAFAFSFEGNGSYLGVQTSEITKDNFSKYGLSDVRGVAVAKVVEGSPAAAAGLKDGDVIVRFNGDAVTSGRKLSRLVSEVSPDHQARLTVLRGGAEHEPPVGRRRERPAAGPGPGVRYARKHRGRAGVCRVRGPLASMSERRECRRTADRRFGAAAFFRARIPRRHHG